MPYDVVKRFEAKLCEYTGAPYAVAVNSCSMALLLAVGWHLRDHRLHEMYGSSHQVDPEIEIPKRTYVSVPMSIIHAGGRPTFRDEEWRGAYQLKPLPVWDSARSFNSGMFNQITAGEVLLRNEAYPKPLNKMLCISFHASKILGDTQGGAILHDSPEADAWFRRARFDGRTEGVAPKDDTFTQVGWHCYISPDVAARLLLKLHSLPKHNDPLPNDEYPNLSLMEIFK